jgi:hypothetical protein
MALNELLLNGVAEISNFGMEEKEKVPVLTKGGVAERSKRRFNVPLIDRTSMYMAPYVSSVSEDTAFTAHEIPNGQHL